MCHTFNFVLTKKKNKVKISLYGNSLIRLLVISTPYNTNICKVMATKSKTPKYLAIFEITKHKILLSIDSQLFTSLVRQRN